MGSDATTPLDRWQALLRGEILDRPPCDYWGTAEVTARLMRDLGCADERQLWERLGVDKLIHLGPRHPRASSWTWHSQSIFDVWKIGTAVIEYAGGLGAYEEAVVHPLAATNTIADVEAFDWPDPGEWDVGRLKSERDGWAGYPLLAGSCELFYLYCRLRGMERALEDLVENQTMVECALEHILCHDLALIGRILDEVGDRILFVYVAEDLGTQESLIMSPGTFRKLLKPRMAKVIDLVHSRGVRVFHHDDGAIRALIPDLLDIGIDLLNPIQWRCRGMDREALARDFGSKVIFHGGVDNQQTLPYGTPEEVRCEVRENLRIFGGGRGYVVAPCHNLQANTPTENILAMYDAVRSA